MPKYDPNVGVWNGLGILILPLLLFVMVPEALNAEGRVEDAVKASYVVNFCYFTAWPDAAFADASAPIDCIVFGRQEIWKAFAPFDGQQVGSRQLRVRSMKAVETINDCHLVYFAPETDRTLIAAALHRVRHIPVLTIGERPDFIRMGGIIEISGNFDQFHFKVMPERATRRGLKISSRLLKLATILDH